jgi:UDPglucose 6-dehydrogenase
VPVIGYAGLTHLGLVSTVASAARGFQTVGYCDDPALARRLARNEPHVVEPGLAELMRSNASRLAVSAEASALAGCDIVYVSVDVPTNDDGESDLRPISAMVTTATSVMKPDALLVVLCQVPPGFTRGLNLPPGRVYYQVETLIFGRAVERAMAPERIIVGCADPDRPLDPRLSAFLSAFDAPVLVMKYESAELAKIAINMCLVASISVANTMAEICEHVGADWSEIVPSLRLDRRIGPHSYLTPGLGLAGGNLERDLATVSRLTHAHGTDGGVVAAWLANSRHRKDWAWQTLRARVLARMPRANIGVLGLAYKENTHSTKNSPALALLAHLGDRPVRVFDPVVPASVAGPAAVDAGSAAAVADGVDALCIMTPWPEFKALKPTDLAERMSGRTILDPYRVLAPSSARASGFDYHTLGAAPRVRAAAC